MSALDESKALLATLDPLLFVDPRGRSPISNQEAIDLRACLTALVAEVDSFDGLMRIARQILDEHYPASVFTGGSGDPGPVFVARLREALDALPNPPSPL